MNEIEQRDWVIRFDAQTLQKNYLRMWMKRSSRTTMENILSSN